MAWYRIVLHCERVPSHDGEKAVQRITEGFSQRRWHRKAICTWDERLLTLVVENDFDREGRATIDEFSDEISARVSGGFDGDIRLVSVTEIAVDA